MDMLVAMQHSRAVLVKLADRLHDMRTLGALPLAKRDRMAQETLDIWAPLANRVGLWNMKAPLEDLAFKQLHPADYADLRERLEAQQRPETLVCLVDRLRAELDREGIRWGGARVAGAGAVLGEKRLGPSRWRGIGGRAAICAGTWWLGRCSCRL